MKKFFNILILLFVMIAASSCIEVETTLKVNKDGSGTIVEKTIASPAMIGMISSFKSMGDSADTEEFSLMDLEELKANALEMGEGVRFIKAENIGKDNSGYIAYYEFDDIRKVRVVNDPGEKVPSDGMGEEAVEEEDPEYITFDFIEGGEPTLIIKMPPKNEEDLKFESGETEESSDTLENNMWAEQFKMMMKDMKFVVRVQVDGTVEETNATYSDGSTITLFEMDMGQILDNPEKFNELTKKQPDSFNQLADEIKDVPGIKIELKETVKIKFD